MSTTKIIIAGFGGQGILFTGKLLTYQGLLDGKYVSWLPSYGPEVRGGTCNCSVIISDEPIGSPIIDAPDVVIAMNRPSLDKYEPTVAKGGKLFVESSLIDRKAVRTDIDVYYVPAVEIADENGDNRLGNMVMHGKFLSVADCLSFDNVGEALEKIISARHRDLLDINLKILRAGAQIPD